MNDNLRLSRSKTLLPSSFFIELGNKKPSRSTSGVNLSQIPASQSARDIVVPKIEEEIEMTNGKSLTPHNIRTSSSPLPTISVLSSSSTFSSSFSSSILNSSIRELSFVENIDEELKKEFISDTNIIDDLQDKLFILETLLEENMMGKSSILYRGTRDGFNSQTFHNLCDSKGSTLIILKSENGRKFGGFAFPSWTQNGWILDTKKKTFIFSLENNCKLKLGGKYDRIGEKSICGHPEYGPWFGFSDLRICSQSDTRCGSVSQLGYSFSLPPKVNYSGKSSWKYLSGDHCFLLKEIEVYSIE